MLPGCKDIIIAKKSYSSGLLLKLETDCLQVLLELLAPCHVTLFDTDLGE
jgi:hypothetical protein